MAVRWSTTGAAVVTDSSVTVTAGDIGLIGAVKVDGPLLVTGDITGLGKVIDTTGNTPNHKH